MVRRIGMERTSGASTPSGASGSNLPDWLPVVVLPGSVIAVSRYVPSWAFMWLLAYSIYFSLKWLTWRRWRTQIPHAAWRSPAYLLAWPGMDAKGFLDSKASVARPLLSAWLKAILTTALGIFLFCFGARAVPPTQPLLQGFTGMLGVAFILHFGSFRLLALIWQTQGVNATPIMQAPLFAKTLSEFWGRRWNVGFRDLAHRFVFEPVRRKFGTGAASFLVFIVSGLIHELVISLPAHGGYGLPTFYFALQGVAAALERSSFGKRFNLRQGWRGRLFAIAVVAGPAFLLFHPPFIFHVVIPCMKAVHAL